VKGRGGVKGRRRDNRQSRDGKILSNALKCCYYSERTQKAYTS
jgi:hypothetical protein